MFYHNQNNKRGVFVSLITICYVDIHKSAVMWWCDNTVLFLFHSRYTLTFHLLHYTASNATYMIMFIYSIQKPNQCLLLFQSFISSKTILQIIKLFSYNITITTWNQSIFKLWNQSILKSICTLKYIFLFAYQMAVIWCTSVPVCFLS